MSARHFPSRSPVLPSGFPPRIHASGIPGRDSCFRNSDPGFAFRIHGSGFWPGPRILAGPPDSGWAPGFWLGPRILAGPPVHSRFSAGFPQFFRDLRCFPAVFQRLRSLPTVFPRPHPAVSSAVSPAVPRQYPGSPLSSPPAAPGGIPGSPKFPQQFPRQFPAAPRQFPGGTRRHPGSSKSPRQFPRQFPQHSSRRPPGYLMSWRLTFLSEKEKVLPTPNSLRTVIRSPCASMMCLTMARPSPVPPCSRERPLSVR